MAKKPDLLIMGSGAMACLFGARLAPLADVTLLGTWEAGLAAIERQGICVLGPDGQEQRQRVRVAREPSACRGARQALVLVKSWQTERAARQLAECLDPEGVALTLQNGLGNLEILVDHLSPERAALGITTMGATLVEPGIVRVGGVGPTHVARHPRLGPVASLLEQAGFEVHFEAQIVSLVWGKLAINAAINPLTAMLEVPNGELLQREGTLAVMTEAAREAQAVAEAQGVGLPFAEAAARALEVAERTAANHSSMLQDIRRGAPTEIEAICGAVVREGRRHGVETPVNWTLWHLVQAKAQGSKGAHS